MPALQSLVDFIRERQEGDVVFHVNYSPGPDNADIARIPHVASFDLEAGVGHRLGATFRRIKGMRRSSHQPAVVQKATGPTRPDILSRALP